MSIFSKKENEWFEGPWPSCETSSQGAISDYDPDTWTGEKFPGGLAPTLDLLKIDYWTLRQKSEELFYKNGYAKGIIRRYVTNIIGTGLSLELNPEEKVLGLKEGELDDWAEDVENMYHIWETSPEICDVKGQRTYGQLQAQIDNEAAIGGDCLVVCRQHPTAKVPQVEIIRGSRVRTPISNMMDEKVIDGVHIGDNGEHLGFYVEKDFEYEYIPARGPETGRLQAWLYYGVEKREDCVRGEPLLAIALQALSDIDKYRDSANRRAFLGSCIVAAVQRDQANQQRTRPISGAAVKAGATKADDIDGRSVETSSMLPGVFLQGLAKGEKVEFFNSNYADINFAAFEAAILVGLSWHLEIPPEILLMSFNKNYSASQAALNEWQMVLRNKVVRFGAENNDKVFKEWFTSQVLINKIKAPGYIQALLDPKKWEIVKAWTLADWSGVIKPKTDILKNAKGYRELLDIGIMTYEQACRETTGKKFTKVIKQRKKENLMWLEAMMPLQQLKKGSQVEDPEEEEEEEKEDDKNKNSMLLAVDNYIKEITG